jgi:hypothetical protein
MVLQPKIRFLFLASAVAVVTLFGLQANDRHDIIGSATTTSIATMTLGSRRTLFQSNSNSENDHDRRRVLVPPHHHGSSGSGSGSSSTSSSDWKGCLEYSDYQLSYSWKFDGDAPSCSWVHHDYGYDSDDYGSIGNGSGGGSGSGGSSSNEGGNGGSSSSGGSNGSSGGDGDDGGDGNGANEGEGGDGDDNGNNNDGEGGGDGDGDNKNGDGSDVVVSNEDVSGGSGYDPLEDFDILNVSCSWYITGWSCLGLHYSFAML